MTEQPPTAPPPSAGSPPATDASPTAGAAGAAAQLAPPAAAATLTLAPPEPVAAVAPAQSAQMVPLDAAVLPGLDKMAADYVDALVTLDDKAPEFTAKTESIRTMGDDDIRAAAEVSNRLLQQPVKDMGKGGFGEGAKVSQSLLDLRRQIEDLDPKQASGVKKLLGIIPFGDKIQDYFRKYESAQKHLNAILNALYDGQDELRKDNAALEQEKAHLWETMQRLGQYIYLAERLDAALAAKITQIEATDPEKAKKLREDVLFYVRQKHQDLLTQMAVSIQGYLSIDLIRKNNTELIKGVDRATTTTISALRTAVIVAQALANEKLVLDQITALNTTTSNMIESTSQLLASNTVSINEQAASSTIQIDKLQAAFNNIYQTMDAIDTFKQQALGAMQTTIDTLNTEVTKAQAYLARAHDGAKSEAAADTLHIPEAGK
jgi:uncharacterized protein YaaN involved in tellurite resistance